MTARSAITVACLGVAAAVLLSAAWRVRSAGQAPEASTRRPSEPAPPPTARPDDYVGSRACATCHAGIAAAFAAHPMGRSLGPVGGVEPIENDAPQVVTDRQREYAVERRDGTVVHVARLRDQSGAVVEHAEPIRFALGSGRRGRSYLVEHAGRLFQSPLGWYTQRGGWDLSPGYREDPELRFARAIDESCLYCHAGRTEPADARASTSTGRFSARVFLEEAIGCERCHGPGGRHVAVMERAVAGVPPADPCIVNPAELDPARREAVCNQCHLAGEAVIPRFGRGFLDFRPGDLLDDTLVVLVAADGDRRAAVSHVEQLRASNCFIASDGALGCTSCHDPHTTPPPADRAAFFRDRCMACHDESACGVPAARRETEAAGSCITCHMPARPASDVPHAAMTDHTIPRVPAEAAPTAAAPVERVAVFDGAEARLPRREVDRARGLWTATEALRRRDRGRAIEAVELLLGDPPAGPGAAGVPDLVADDVPALLALGDLFAATGREPPAVACYARALVSAPDEAAALAGLSDLRARAGDRAGALALADRLAAVRPTAAEAHGRRAALLASLGRWADCRDAATRAVALDPLAPDARRLLIEACRRSGDEAMAEVEEGTLRRLLDASRPGTGPRPTPAEGAATAPGLTAPAAGPAPAPVR